ncbi:hypothetical protein PIROE2DRAFT_69108 [Piromyces sp. E2]|nr:hypothetical protein PIROE2DRAFT_69108 [Piromyces sp. E2]|eukprot:OUM65351.1 hypothetical protein PIROE2DRAFT_69108 [Piromyces sp. E2]
MKTNFICKAFLLTAALFSSSMAKTVEENLVIEKNEFSNTATYIGGPVDGIIDNNSKTKCDVNIDDLEQYAVVSKKVFGIEDICEDHYVVALSTDFEDTAKFKMIKARIVESSEKCNDAQIILNKEAYDKISTNEEKANIIWAVVDVDGNIKVKVNYESFAEVDENVGIPAEELESIFEESAKAMVNKNVDAQGYPWDVVEGDSHSSIAAISVAIAGIACFAGYRFKSKKNDTEDSLAIPDLPALDTTINTVSDHPEGLPRVDIYNPPLEFYHFPMDTSYDIVDIRPDFYD